MLNSLMQVQWDVLRRRSRQSFFLVMCPEERDGGPEETVQFPLTPVGGTRVVVDAN